MCIPFLIIYFTACCSFEISHGQRNWRNEGVYGVQFFSILSHLFCDTKLGEWFGSRDYEREAFTYFISPSFCYTLCTFLSHFHIVRFLSFFPILSFCSAFSVENERKKATAQQGVHAFFVFDLGGFVLILLGTIQREKTSIMGACNTFIYMPFFLLVPGRVCELYITWLYPYQFLSILAIS